MESTCTEARAPAAGRYPLFLTMLLSTVMSAFMQTSLATLLPAIMEEFSISAADAQWLNTTHSLVTAIIIPASAFLMRRFSLKKLYCVSLLIMMAGLLLCGFGASFPMLLLGRLLQAVSMGVSMSLLQVVILTVFPRNQQGLAMGLYGIACSVAPSFAPALAGLLCENLGWRVLFQGVLALYVPLLALALLFVRDVLETEKVRLDVPSFLLSAAGFCGVTIGVGNLAGGSAGGVAAFAPLLAGLLALGLFTRRQLRMPKPFLDVNVLRERHCRAGTLTSMLLYASLIAGSTLTPMYTQMVRGLSPSASGLTLLPGSLAMAAVSLLTGKLYDRYGIRKIAVAGSLVMLLSCAGYCFVGETTWVPLLVILSVLRSVAVGCLMMPLVTWGMSRLSPAQTPHGTAILTSLRTIAGALGSAVFVGVMSAASRLTAAVPQSAVTESGMRLAFLLMTALAAIQLVYTLKSVKG